jgi:oligoribonuclease (3'-5' exoribonuclease)
MDEILWVTMINSGHTDADVPLEIGFALTDFRGELKRIFSQVIWEYEYDSVKISDGTMNFLKSTGLWSDLQTGTLTRDQTQDLIIRILKNEGTDKVILGGACVGAMIRPKLKIHFPKLYAALSVTDMDVASLNSLCGELNEPLYDKIYDELGYFEGVNGRAQSDAKALVEEYKHYVDSFFFQAE